MDIANEKLFRSYEGLGNRKFLFHISSFAKPIRVVSFPRSMYSKTIENAMFNTRLIHARTHIPAMRLPPHQFQYFCA